MTVPGAPPADPPADPARLPAVGEESAGPVVTDAALGVSGAARRLGVAPATLRSWERRYGIAPSRHTAGGHRRYAPADIARLQVMQRLIRDGVPPAEAARAALSTPDDRATPVPPARSSGGGRVLALPRRPRATRGLARSAIALDASACQHAMTASLADQGAVSTWDELVRPVLAAIGDRWERTGQGVEAEHTFSAIAYGALSAHAARLTRAINDRPVLLASVADELHDLPLVALRAALADRGVRCHLIGARTPDDALDRAIVRLGPPVLFLWAQMGPAQLPPLPSLRPAPLVLVGGPGWAELPSAVRHMDDLVGAVGAVRSALGV